MDKYLMNSTKLLWHLDRLKDWSDGKRIAPLHIELGITNACQLRCVYCYSMFFTDKKVRVDLPKITIKNLFEDAKKVGVRSITLVGEGENTLSPYFYDSLKYARDINLDLGIATNGIALATDKLKEVLESFVWIRFSIGGADRNSYRKIHGADQFYKVMNIIENAVNIKNKHNLKTTLGMQMVVIKENMSNVLPLTKLGKKLGVDYFVAKPCSDTPDKQLNVPHEEYLKMADIFDEARKYQTEDYSVIIKKDKFFNVGVNSFNKCLGTQFIIAIDAKGNVAPCGHLLGYRAKEFNMGNICKTSFKDIVESERYWKVQERVKTLNVNTECETNCLHSKMNVFLDKLSIIPEHINFV